MKAPGGKAGFIMGAMAMLGFGAVEASGSNQPITLSNAAANAFNYNGNNGVVGNILNAADAILDFGDPTIAGYSTVRDNIKSATGSISNGNYLQAFETMAKTPIDFGNNVIQSGYGMGYAAHQAYNDYQSNLSVTDSLPQTPPSATTIDTIDSKITMNHQTSFMEQTANTGMTQQALETMETIQEDFQKYQDSIKDKDK